MLDNSPKLKKFLLYVMYHPYAARPRWWVRAFIIPFVIKRKKGAIIRRKARLDIMLSKKFSVGYKAIVEDYAIINNGMGDVIIGDYSKILSRSLIVGPVTIGNKVVFGNGACISALVHNYEDIKVPIDDQGVSLNRSIIEDDVWIGSNCCINQGVKIGRHVVVGSGSVVTRDIPSYSVAVGNPAKVIKQYNFESKKWEKV